MLRLRCFRLSYAVEPMKHARRRILEETLLPLFQLDANEREIQTCCSFENFSMMKGVQNRFTPFRCDFRRNSFGIVPSLWHTASGNWSWYRSLLLPK